MRVSDCFAVDDNMNDNGVPTEHREALCAFLAAAADAASSAAEDLGE